MKNKSLLAWHFVDHNRRLRNGQPLVIGEWLQHDGKPVLCMSGYHASAKALDALIYRRSNMVCRVECAGPIVHGNDKLVCSRRKALWCFDATTVLREFARWCALQVIDYWDCPAIVRIWLETGDAKFQCDASDSIQNTYYCRAYSPFRNTAWNAAAGAARSAITGSAHEAACNAAQSVSAGSFCSANHSVYTTALDVVWRKYNAKLEKMLKAAYRASL